MLYKKLSNFSNSIDYAELADSKIASDLPSTSRPHIDPAENELPIIEGELVPIETPKIGTILRRFKSTKSRRERGPSSRASIVVGFDRTTHFQWLFFCPSRGFFSMTTGQPADPPKRFLALTGIRHTSKPSPDQIAIPILRDVLAHLPSAAPGNHHFEPPYKGSTIVGVSRDLFAPLPRFIWVGSDGNYWDILTQTRADPPPRYIQLSPGDSGFDARTFPLPTDCRGKATKKSEILISR